MKVAVIRLPGANCDQDGLHALRDHVGVEAEYVWHEDHDLRGYDAVFLPGGFTFGDYLRVGAIAARSPVMQDVRKFAEEGGPVIGPCNGFQMLCELGLLPGVLMRNEGQKFRCHDVWVRRENSTSAWTEGADRPLRLPIAHGEGRYVCDDETLARLEGEGLIAFRYCDATGEVTPESNPNGSRAGIAGLVNARGNVLGLMPHPERATHKVLGGTDGLAILNALKTLRV